MLSESTGRRSAGEVDPGNIPADRSSRSLRFQLVGGVVVLLFLALFILAVVVIVWLRLGLSPVYLGLAMAVGMAGTIALLGLFADYRLKAAVLEPVATMVDGAEKIAAGDDRHRLRGEGAAELERLASALNEMAGQLIRNQHLLADNVASLDETNRALTEAHTELIQSAKLASVGRLAAGIAHEVGNPLGAILGYLELGKRTVDADEEWIAGISHEVTRIDRIVRGLLDYGRPKPASTREFQVNEVVQRSLDIVSVQGLFKTSSVDVSLAEELPEVQADPFQLEQVMVNLFLNAADAIEETGGRGALAVTTRLVEVAAPSTRLPLRRRDDPEGIDYSHLRRLDEPIAEQQQIALPQGSSAVEIRVRDSGPGIDPGLAPHVFEPFFTTKEPGRGTGLGLAVSARLVYGMGGTIEAAEAPEDGGAEFRVFLPVHEREAKE
jgi:two-component system, NtrC family, sensor kinase